MPPQRHSGGELRRHDGRGAREDVGEAHRLLLEVEQPRLEALHRRHVGEHLQHVVAAQRRVLEDAAQLAHRRVAAVRPLEAAEQRPRHAEAAHEAVERVAHLVRRHREEVLLELGVARHLRRLDLRRNLPRQRRLRLLLRLAAQPPLRLLALEAAPQRLLGAAAKRHPQQHREHRQDVLRLLAELRQLRPPDARAEARGEREPVRRMDRVVADEGMVDEDEQPRREELRRRAAAEGRIARRPGAPLLHEELPHELEEDHGAAHVQVGLLLVLHVV